MSKTTVKQFDLFRSECLKWIDIFGLKDYEIHFEHSDKATGNGNVAYCIRDCNGRVARLSLCQTWNDNYIVRLSDESIKLAAFEEVCHIFLYSLSSCANARFVMEHEINEAEHGLIRVLQSVLYPKY